jgi:hypothetical protein
VFVIAAYVGNKANSIASRRASLFFLSPIVDWLISFVKPLVEVFNLG